jgi:hypothetical protein
MIKFTFETDASFGRTSPKLKINNQLIELKEGVSTWNVAVPDLGCISLDFFSKVESDTICDHTGIIKDTQFKINKIWIDDILVEPWFKNIAVYRPQYFDGFLTKYPNSPSVIVSPYQFNFPGLIEWCWEPNFWDWYFKEKNKREVINFSDKDPDRVWKFRGSVDPCDDLVKQIKELIKI